MNVHDMTEQAYKNGYAKGYADAKKNEKHGRWEQARYTEAPLYICSKCDKHEYKQHRYCPNCGAQMDLPNITETTRKALDKMGENVHSEIDFDYAAED